MLFRSVLPLFVGAVLIAGLLVANTFETLAAAIILYLASLPYGVARYRKMERAWKLGLTTAEPEVTT